MVIHPENGRKLVNVMDACAIVDVSRRTIYYWIKLKKVETARLASGKQLIYVDTLFKSLDGR